MSYSIWEDYADRRHPSWRTMLRYTGKHTTLRRFIRAIYKKLSREIPADLREWSMPRLRFEYIERSCELFVWETNRQAWQDINAKAELAKDRKRAAYHQKMKSLPPKKDEQLDLL